MLVYIGGEDFVTKAVAKRLIQHTGCKEIEFEDVSPRDYGTKALEKLDLAVRLGESYPVVCVFDSDGDCVVDLLQTHTSEGWKRDRLAVNIAVDEAESWLMADREGLARFLGVKPGVIPRLMPGKKEISDSLPYKTSLYIMNEIVPLSEKANIIKHLTPVYRNKKPPTYNGVWQKFVYEHWNIDAAVQNSASLTRAVKRVSQALGIDS